MVTYMDISQQSNPDRILSRSEFRELTNLSRTQEWRMLNAGKLPAAVVIDGRILGFRESAYLDWLEKNTKA